MTVKKPTIDDVMSFAEEKPVSKSGKVPTGDIRLTVNVSAEVHLALKIASATQRVTMGELVEQMVREKYCD